MVAVIASADDATAEWLTAALRGSETLARGRVVEARPRANAAFNSSIVHLELAYSPDAPSTAPGRVLLKLNRDDDGATEVAFYRIVAELRAPLPMLVRCYSAEHDATTGNSVCLLEDISETHVPPVQRSDLVSLRGVPSELHLVKIVDALAAFHAYWWQHPVLGQVKDLTDVRWWYRDHRAHQAHVLRRQREWSTFIAEVGDWFPADLRSLYERALANLPGLWDRYLEPRVTTHTRITLTNGDCYLTQFLCPRDPTIGMARLVDFQDASANLASYDLAYLIPTVWTPAQRSADQRERSLLRRYHQALTQHGVTDFSEEDLVVDYRLMISYMIFDPVWNQTAGADRSYWWPKLQCLTGAYLDLDCPGLL